MKKIKNSNEPNKKEIIKEITLMWQMQIARIIEELKNKVKNLKIKKKYADYQNLIQARLKNKSYRNKMLNYIKEVEIEYQKIKKTKKVDFVKVLLMEDIITSTRKALENLEKNGFDFKKLNDLDRISLESTIEEMENKKNIKWK